VIGRLKDGVTISAASADLLARIPYQSGRDLASAIRLRSELEDTRSDFRTTITVLSGAVGFIVLIGCVNVAGLLLARGAVRETELAIRASIGAGRSRLLRQLLTESLILSTIGGLAGLLLAWLTLDVIVANIPIDLPGDAPARLNGFVLAATALTVIVTAVLFGLVPAFRLSHVSPARMAGGARHAGASLSRRGGQFIIGIEVALAIIMVAGAALMTRSLSHLLAVDLGFDPDRYLTLKAEPLEPQARHQYYPALLQQLGQLPDVEIAGAVDNAPLADGITMGGFRRGDAELQMVTIQTTLPGYFEALGLPLRAGRTFTDHDRTAAGAIVISEAAARLFFSDQTAIGQRLERVMAQPRTFEVIGVVGDVKHFGPQSRGDPAVYQVVPQVEAPGFPAQPLTVLVRPRPGAKQLPDRLRSVAEAVGPKVIVDGVKRGSDWLDRRVALTRHRTTLLGLLGGLGLLLALIGVFGMTSYAVARRTREIGIRVALGASSQSVVSAVLRDAVIPIVIGVAAGTGGSIYATAAIKTFLFKTSPTDPMALAMVVALMLAVGGLAAWLPARRAARIDPIVALRE
jgi:predicted permease